MLIDMQGVTKIYPIGDVSVRALADVSLQIQAGEDVAIVGPSGSGKSTLLSLLGCLDIPSGGQYCFGGDEVVGLPRAQLARLRNRRIGFVFQSFNLLPRLTARENVELPLIYASWARSDRAARSLELLSAVGLADRRHHYPSQLSGGEQQRVAIARALANQPDLILADEPTGALDKASGRMILDMLDSVKRAETTLVLVTHDASVPAQMSRIVTLVDGRVKSDVLSVRSGDGSPREAT